MFEGVQRPYQGIASHLENWPDTVRHQRFHLVSFWPNDVFSKIRTLTNEPFNHWISLDNDILICAISEKLWLREKVWNCITKNNFRKNIQCEKSLKTFIDFACSLFWNCFEFALIWFECKLWSPLRKSF